MTRYSTYLGSPGADEVQTVKNIEDSQTVCPQILGKWKTETCGFRRQLKFCQFGRIYVDGIVKLACYHTFFSFLRVRISS